MVSFKEARVYHTFGNEYMIHFDNHIKVIIEGGEEVLIKNICYDLTNENMFLALVNNDIVFRNIFRNDNLDIFDEIVALIKRNIKAEVLERKLKK